MAKGTTAQRKLFQNMDLGPISPTETAKRNVFPKVQKIIAEETEIPIKDIEWGSDIIHDLEIESLNFLDIVFYIDKELGTKIPLEDWIIDINENRVGPEHYFRIDNLCTHIERLQKSKL